MDEDWTNARPCVLCGEPTPGPDVLCALCEAEAVAESDGDAYAETYDPADWGEWDTDEELPCLHADGCPGHRRCRVCV